MNMAQEVPGPQINMSLLTEEEKYLLQHKGHEKQHQEMFLILIGTLIASQFGLVYWKRRHLLSFQLFSLACLWAFPFLFSLYFYSSSGGATKFLLLWTLFSLIYWYLISIATKQKIDSQTPATVFVIIHRVYQLCYGTGILGYVFIVSELMGMNTIFIKPQEGRGTWLFQFGSSLFFYALYFGVMGRDLVDLLSDRMAASIGYYNKNGLPTKHLRSNICAICGDEIEISDNFVNSQQLHEQPQQQEYPYASKQAEFFLKENAAYELECRHRFHEKCIRGWCVVGKKDMCPYCKEKVDLKQFRKKPWDTQELMFVQMLDAVRYFIVYQPLIFIIAQGFIYMSGLD
jgi:RING finger protein 121/175